MSSILQKLRSAAMQQGLTKAEAAKLYPTIPITEHPSFPVDIPDSFLAPLADPSQITMSRIDFKNSPLPEYKDLYAVVLDNVLTQTECDQLLHMAELSTGAHLEEHGDDAAGGSKGWKQALVRAGRRHEILAIEYRDSGRILWDEKQVVKRFFNRILQAKGMRDYLNLLEGKEYDGVVGKERLGGRWKLTEQGPNEKMRFLRYGAGQFFKEHCDGSYETEDGSSKSFYTIHLYLNDSAQVLGIPESEDWKEEDREVLRGGATTFSSSDLKRRLDVDPKAGRALVFQHKGLLHSGDQVTAGVKYTMRCDLMYEWQDVAEDDDDGGVVFG